MKLYYFEIHVKEFWLLFGVGFPVWREVGRVLFLLFCLAHIIFMNVLLKLLVSSVPEV